MMKKQGGGNVGDGGRSDKDVEERPVFTSMVIGGRTAGGEAAVSISEDVNPACAAHNRPSSNKLSATRPARIGSGSIPRPASLGAARSAGVAKPSSTLSRPRIGHFASSPSQGSTVPPPQAVRSNWNVADASLKPLPPFSPPLPAHTSTVVNDSSPSVVAARISDCFQRRSISAIYDDDNALAKAWTWDGICFTVQLHRASSGEEDGFEDFLLPQNSSPAESSAAGVLVEIQLLRRASVSGNGWTAGPNGEGSVVCFHRDYCRPLLQAASGDSDGLPRHVQRTQQEQQHGDALFPPSVSRRHRCRTGTTGTENVITRPGQEHESGTELASLEKTLFGLENALDLMKRDRMDANRLGMESLCLMTNPDSAGYATALTASRVVLLGHCMPEGVQSEYSDYDMTVGVGEIHAVIYSLITGTELLIGALAGDDEDMREAHLAIFHNLALRTLLQSLQVFQNAGKLDDLLYSPYCRAEVGGELPVIDALLGEIEESALLMERGGAGSELHNAALATRCIYVLAHTSADVRGFVSQHANKILERARRVGHTNHLVLQHECERTLAILGQVGR